MSLAKDNRWKDITVAVKKGISVDAVNTAGETALHVASLSGHLETMQVLITAGANVHALNGSRATPLHLAAAAKQNALSACKLLLASGSNPEASDAHGRFAYELSSDDDVRKLLGAPDPRLFEFVMAGDCEGLTDLLASGAVTFIGAADAEGRTAINMAVGTDNIDVVRVLAAYSFDALLMVDRDGNGPLHVAVELDSTAMLCALLEMGAPTDLQNFTVQAEGDYEGECASGGLLPPRLDKTALHLAVDNANEAAAELLLVAGANAELRDCNGATALQLALEACDDALASLLLRYGADPNAPFKDCSTPLHFVARRGSYVMLNMLLVAGADANATDDAGCTALMLAAHRGAHEHVHMLLASCSTLVGADEQGNTALHLASLGGYADVVSALLAYGADPFAVNARGQTPLEVAANEAVKEALSGMY